MIRIVSGGQTGVDRAALDAAMQTGVECGGWCPKGRKAEDGRIPMRYPLNETGQTAYSQRTLRNVIDSDGTVIIFYGAPTGGTRLTVEYCERERKSHLLIDAETTSVEAASKRIADFVEENGINVLNLAGPRASGESRAYEYTYRVILDFLSQQKGC